MSGTLIVHPIQATLTRDLDTFTKMDPYWLVTLGSQKTQGKVCKGGGKNPHWDDSLTLKVQGENEFYVELKDKDVVSDDSIGVCQVPIKDIISQSKVTNWYTLYHKQKSAGQILLEITFHSSGSQGSGAPTTAQPTQGYGGQPQMYAQPQYGGAPPGGYPQQSYGQPGGYPQQSYPPQAGGFAQPQGYPQQPTGGYTQPHGGYPQTQPHGGYPQTQGYLQQSGGYAQPHGQVGYPTGGIQHGVGGLAHGAHGHGGMKEGKHKKNKDKKDKKDKKNKKKDKHGSSSSSSDSD